VGKKNERRSSDCYHHCCRLFDLGIFGRVWLAWETLAEPTEARWFNVLSALGKGVLGPVLAFAAMALSVAGQRLGLATLLAILAAVIYVAPFAAFFIAIMIYGF
jgi:hypothetical protein